MNFTIIKRKINTFLSKPNVLVLKIWLLFEPIVSDKTFLKVLFRIRVGYWPDLDSPTLFNEKLQWLKLYYKRPEYTKMVDKVEAKKYVSNIIGDKYIIPTFGVWNYFSEIEWDKLPNKFVLKTAHNSGGVVICKDKKHLNIVDVKTKLLDSSKRDYTKYNKEYAYHDVPHRFIAEELLENGNDDDLPDYKFYCFNGNPKFCQVIRNRRTLETIDFFDMNWNHQDFVGLNPKAENGNQQIDRPIHLDELIIACKKLAEGMPFVRIDFYVIKDKEYFGEITFYPASGLGNFRPNEWNRKLGDMLVLPPKMNK